MNENQTPTTETIRPTKKQKDLLTFIEAYITEHGYSPSYREIMTGLEYTSVATVSLHVNSLIKRGHLRKRDRSARSLEVVSADDPSKVVSNQVAAGEEKWLVEKVEHAFNQAEQGSVVTAQQLEELQILLGALRILNIEGAAQSFLTRLADLKQRTAPVAA